MIGPTGAVRVLVATKPVDFRKGAEGLAALVRETMKADPFSGAGLCVPGEARRSHVILHTDCNLLSFTIVVICCIASARAYNNDRHDGVNRLSILRSALTSHGRFPCGCAARRYARRCPWDRRRYRSTR